ncbi:hypothetical protein B4U80_09601 [Leptotrombidium deliense]|uniref:Uncharacterized protein n=1 Tax=Leptotrombidium deliense TaxID=299467 RepID=A0A443RZL4_9ACAR|nr:hypothetical protein B4U80_09601 [Leptotrombidium deliense]
MLIVMTYNVW